MSGNLAQTLLETLDANGAVRSRAEAQLQQLQQTKAFPPLTLEIVRSGPSGPVRQAAALQFKNWVKSFWDLADDSFPLSEDERTQVKAELIPNMMAVAHEHQLYIQLSEAVAIIADIEFPEGWPTLLDDILAGIAHAADSVALNALLGTCHGIFKKYRSLFRSETLWTEIRFVLDKLGTPLRDLFARVDADISNGAQANGTASTSTPVVARGVPDESPGSLEVTLSLLLEIFHDLAIQDLPPFIEDNMPDFMSWLLRYLSQDILPVVAPEDDIEDPSGVREKIKSEICAIASLFAARYMDAFGIDDNSQPLPYAGAFLDAVVNLLTGTPEIRAQHKFDTLVARGISYLTTVVQSPVATSMPFFHMTNLGNMCEQIILPNMAIRPRDEENFVDDPQEYIRANLDAMHDADVSRSAAASGLLQAVRAKFDPAITPMVSQFISQYLAQYNVNPAQEWRAKDAALSLLTSLASAGSTQRLGVTATNALVDVVSFFGEHVLPDLQSPPSEIGSIPHPILQADALKFVLTFRRQLNKDQLLALLPILAPFLSNTNFVFRNYTAIAIERILVLKNDSTNQAILQPQDLASLADPLVNTLAHLLLSQAQTSPALMSENDQVVKCLMRLIVAQRNSIPPAQVQSILPLVVQLISTIAANPANPLFNHFIFEALAALIRVSPSPAFPEAHVLPVFQHILANDIAEFLPFVFQIIAQLLRTHAHSPDSSLPDFYNHILEPILSASLWESRGNVPALADLLVAYMIVRPAEVVPRINPILGIVQFLLSRRSTETYAFALLEALFSHLPSQSIFPVLPSIIMLLLTKLQAATSSKAASRLPANTARLFAALVAINKPVQLGPSLGPTQLIDAVDSCQPGSSLFAGVLNLLIPSMSTILPHDRKLALVGWTKILFDSPADRLAALPQGERLLHALVSLMQLPMLDLAAADPSDNLEEGYSASFSKLATAAPPPSDPVAYVQDVPQFILAKFNEANAREGGRLSSLQALFA